MPEEMAWDLVPLDPTTHEFQSVKNNVMRTESGFLKCIIKIERVQNPCLYLRYQVHKHAVEKANPGIENEKILWHGTSEDATQSINSQGFNRSYCKGAAALGKGVYFALRSGYSIKRFCPHGQNGHRYIYQVKVLTGVSTKGRPRLIDTPVKNQVPYECYDSIINSFNSPKVHVIFSDTRAYPEYLITFLSKH